MADTALSTVLFLGVRNQRRCRVAEVAFNAAAAKFHLAWRAVARGTAPASGPMPKDALDHLQKAGLRDLMATARAPLAPTPEDFRAASRIIAFEEPAYRAASLEVDDRVEFWNAKDFPAIEAMVHGLIARLLGGGGQAPDPPAEAKPKPKKLGGAKVGRETAGRRGKGVTTIFDLTLNEADLKELATKLKNLCGTGGTAKDGRIEIQGDHRDKIIAELARLGFQPKRAGG